ncbi:gluconolactonase [Nannocystis pusilla]|uniref:Gluconolactonase n=1 Tax=Nannocystis pusilla TaxID=889268 RepID=A0ABS7THJ2_9BACT|nr:gluconolactonase [Nannocystis pusilla]MBZ5707693.1 gluconolactonase [Nannocystis pusilla]
MASHAPVLTIALTTLLFVPACGDDGGSTTETTGATSGPTSTETAGTSSTTEPTTGTTSADPTAPPTTTATSTGEEDTASSTTEPATSSTTDEQTTGPGLDCVTIMPGPFAPELVGEGYDGSEDLGFDGAGGLALKRDDAVVIVSADLQETQLADGLPQVYGTRFTTSGDLLVALPQSGDLLAIAGDGTLNDLVGGLDSPNGLYVDTTGRVWLTEFGGSRVVRFDGWSPVTVYEGPMASTANGIVLDEARGLLFFTNYGAGRVLKLEVEDLGEAISEPVEVLAVPGAVLDGLALDACGNVYAVDQGNARLFRGILDGDAGLVGQPELLAEFDSGVANAQFGQGPGWDPESIYLSGNPGDLWRVAVGIHGAPIGLP